MCFPLQERTLLFSETVDRGFAFSLSELRRVEERGGYFI